MKDWTISIDNTSLNIKGRKKTRVYPKSYLNLGGTYKYFTPLVWADISNLKDLGGMTGRFNGGLQGCAHLKTIYAAGTDVSKFTTLKEFFDHCTSLQSIDVSAWNVGNVTDFSNMFSTCTSLKSIDVSEWNVGNVTTIADMFYNCNMLESIDISKWDVRKLKSFQGFLQQQKIKSLDLSGWDLESCTDLRFTKYTLPWVTLRLGPRFFHCPLVTSANWTGLRSWTDDSVKESLVVNSYDRKANGLPDLTLSLSKETKAVLSEDDIAAMTAKGYIIA